MRKLHLLVFLDKTLRHPVIFKKKTLNKKYRIVSFI